MRTLKGKAGHKVWKDVVADSRPKVGIVFSLLYSKETGRCKLTMETRLYRQYSQP